MTISPGEQVVILNIAVADGRMLTEFRPIYAFCHNQEDIAEFVTIIAVHDHKLILVYNRLRQYWELPGGRREPGESSLACAKRELTEEAGVVGQDFQVIGAFQTRLGDDKPIWGLLYNCKVSNKPLNPRSSEISDVMLWNHKNPVGHLAKIDEIITEIAFKCSVNHSMK